MELRQNDIISKSERKLTIEKYSIADYSEFGREPVIRQMNDGTIICLSLTGGETEPRPENYVAITRSYDRGKTWSKVEKLFSHEGFGVWCTEIFTDCEIPFAAVHTPTHSAIRTLSAIWS